MYGGDIHTSKSNVNVRFTENKNQWTENVLYRAELDGGSMFLERNCFTYNFYNKEALEEGHNRPYEKAFKGITSHAFRMTFLNALSTVSVEADHSTSDYCNYFIGTDERKWAGNVKNYVNVTYNNLYDHINLELEGLQNSLKYNFIVLPSGNVNDIQLSYEGLDEISLQKGALRLKTRINEQVEQSPYAYQWIGSRKIEVPCEFVLENKTVHFRFPQGYNKAYELTIDPLVVFSASSGSIANNFGHSCTYDTDGNLYSGGISFGAGYPVKLGYDSSFNGGNVDVVITKYNANGTDLVYSTYLGGSSDEIVTSMIVDAANNLFFYGVTGSTNFPVTAGAYQKQFKGGPYYSPHQFNGNLYANGTDMYVCKFNASGNALLGSSFIGGTSNDGVNSNKILNNGPLDSLQYNYGDYYRGEIDLDKYGNVYIASATRSNDFPVVNGFDNKLDGLQDAVVFKMNTDLSDLIWSTYLGGGDNDGAYALVLDDALNVYVTGGTKSTNFPVTPGALQPNGAGGVDGFVAKIKDDGKALLASTYWGTAAYDQSFFVQLDKKNDVYIFGQTEGKMPVTANVYNNPNSGQFITKMNNTLTTLGFSTVVGNGTGVINMVPTAFLVDVCGNIYAAGWAAGFQKKGAWNGLDSTTTNMPVTPNAVDPTTKGFDFYMIVLRTNADSLLYGTYWGGDESSEHVHGGTSRFDKKGIVYQSLCTGCGGYDDYPITPGAWPGDPNNPNGSTNCNNAVFKIDFQVKLATADFTVDNFKGCAPLTVHFKNQSSSGNIIWDFGNGDTTSLKKEVIKTFTTPGTYLIKLLVNDPASCNIWDTAYQYITVYESIAADFDFDSDPCSNEIKFKDLSVKTPVSWEWDFGDGIKSTTKDPVHVYQQLNTTYPVKLIVKNANGCTDTAVVDVDFVGAHTMINTNKTVCKGAGVQLSASGGFSYAWSPVAGLNDPNIPNPIASPDTTTTYKVKIKVRNALGDTCISELTTKVTVIDPALIHLSATADKDTLLNGESTWLHALTDTTLKIYWSPTTGVKDPKAFNTLVTPSTTTTYTVTINDSLGCSKSAVVTIYVKPNDCDDDDVFVPNTFTPNGDGQNDVLYARSNHLTTAYFAVYNRWGELVFETTDLDKGWDGVYKGMKADPAVFAWYVKGKCFNGKEFFKKGNVTLIR